MGLQHGNLKPTRGRVLVELVAEATNSPIQTAKAETPVWGKVIQLGDPTPDTCNERQMKEWVSSGTHPSEFKVGDEIMLPKQGRIYDLNGKKCMIFWQLDVAIFRSSNI